MNKKENESKASPDILRGMALPACLGAGAALLLLLLLMLLMATLILGGVIPETTAGLGMNLCAGVCALVGGRVAVQAGKGQPMVPAAISAGILSLSLVVVSVAMTGQAALHHPFAGNLLMILAGGGIAGLMGRKKKTGKKKRRP